MKICTMRSNELNIVWVITCLLQVSSSYQKIFSSTKKVHVNELSLFTDTFKCTAISKAFLKIKIPVATNNLSLEAFWFYFIADFYSTISWCFFGYLSCSFKHVNLNLCNIKILYLVPMINFLCISMFRNTDTMSEKISKPNHGPNLKYQERLPLHFLYKCPYPFDWWSKCI